jgi:hypothetical protein
VTPRLCRMKSIHIAKLFRSSTHPRPANARCMQCRDDRLAFVAENVRYIVIVLFVRLHHVENHRLRLLAGGTINAGEAFLQVTGHCGIVWHVEGHLAGERPRGRSA